MRIRADDANGDYTFGSNTYNVDNIACVSQAVEAELVLFLGTWFLDTTYGMPWYTGVIGKNSQLAYDQEIKNHILGVQGVSSIVSYSSTLSASRALTVFVEYLCVYSASVIATTVSVPLETA